MNTDGHRWQSCVSLSSESLRSRPGDRSRPRLQTRFPRPDLDCCHAGPCFPDKETPRCRGHSAAESQPKPRPTRTAETRQTPRFSERCVPRRPARGFHAAFAPGRMTGRWMTGTWIKEHPPAVHFPVSNFPVMALFRVSPRSLRLFVKSASLPNLCPSVSICGFHQVTTAKNP